MAKGDPSGTYVPEPFGGQTEDYLWKELQRIAASFEFSLARNVEFLHVEPTKVREGMVVGADGTDWNPGSGQGVYCYYNGAWNKLG